MSNIDCNACEDLRTSAPHFVQNGITSTECTSLAADTGLNPNLSPKHNDATDLHDVNDCLIGRMPNELEEYNVCDWQDFMAKFIPNVYETVKGIICALGGVWTNIHNLLSRVGGLETRMDNAESDISGLKTRMTTAEGNITNLKTRMTDAESDISGLKTRMTNAEGSITTLQTTVTDHGTRISTLENNISGYGTRITNLENTVSGYGTRITNLENTVSGYGTRIGSLESTVSGHTTSISSLQSTVSGHTTSIGNLQNTVSSHTSSINDHGSRITTLENSLSSATSTISGHTTSINNINNSITAINNKLQEIIDAMGGDIDSIPVMRRYRVNVPKSAFGQVWRVTSGAQQANNTSYQDVDNPNYFNVSDITEWFAGAGNNEDIGELWVKVPVTEMTSITGVWTQTLVVPGGNPYDGKGKAFIQTVNVQQWYEDNGYLYINYDVYELCPKGGGTAPYNGGPYPVTVDFLVVGMKDLT